MEKIHTVAKGSISQNQHLAIFKKLERFRPLAHLPSSLIRIRWVKQTTEIWAGVSSWQQKPPSTLRRFEFVTGKTDFHSVFIWPIPTGGTWAPNQEHARAGAEDKRNPVDKINFILVFGSAFKLVLYIK